MLTILQKVYFHLNICFQKAQRYTCSIINRQPSIRLDYPEAGAKYEWGRNMSDAFVPAKSHSGSIPAPFSKIICQSHFLAWLLGSSLSYTCLNFWFYVPKSHKAEDNKKRKHGHGLRYTNPICEKKCPLLLCHFLVKEFSINRKQNESLGEA